MKKIVSSEKGDNLINIKSNLHNSHTRKNKGAEQLMLGKVYFSINKWNQYPTEGHKVWG